MDTETGYEEQITPKKRKRPKALIVVTIIIFCLLGVGVYDYYLTAQEEARKEARVKARRIAKQQRIKAEAEERQRREEEESRRLEAEAAEAKRKREMEIAELTRQKEERKKRNHQAAETVESRRQAVEAEVLRNKAKALPPTKGLMAKALKNAYFISETRPSPDAKYYIFLLMTDYRIGFIREHYKQDIISDGGEFVCLYTGSEQEARQRYTAHGLKCPAMLWSDVPFLPDFPAAPSYGELFYTAVMNSYGQLEQNKTEKCQKFLQDLYKYKAGNSNAYSTQSGKKNVMRNRIKKLHFAQEKPSTDAAFYLFAFLPHDTLKRNIKQLKEEVNAVRTNQSTPHKMEFIGISYGDGDADISIPFPMVSIADPNLTKIPGYADRASQNPFFAVNQEGTPIPLWQSNDDYAVKPPQSLLEWRDKIKKTIEK